MHAKTKCYTHSTTKENWYNNAMTNSQHECVQATTNEYKGGKMMHSICKETKNCDRKKMIRFFLPKYLVQS